MPGGPVRSRYLSQIAISAGVVEARASGGGLSGGAESVVVSTDQQVSALLRLGKERRVLHLEPSQIDERLPAADPAHAA
jgi:hypothetical protein